MKHLKMLGLAAVAAGTLMAFVGAGSASANTLCTVNTTPCPAASTIPFIHATQIGSGVLETLESGETLITCAKATMLADQTKDGGNTSSGPVTALQFTECNPAVTVLSTGSLTVSSTGVTTVKEAGITSNLFGASCTYGTGAGTTLGTFKTGTPASLTINAVIPKTAGSFLCPSSTRWTATFQITNHTSVFNTAS